MAQRRLWVLLVSLSVMITAIGLLPVAAQEGNLLRDGGFEGSYTNRGRTDLNIPADWNLWVSESPRTEAWMNLPPVAFPHNGPDPNPHGGSRALNLNKGFGTFTAAVYQQVAVPQGSNVTASAWAFMRTCNIPAGSDKCGSAVESGAYTRIGIDPNGGANPFDGDVVWSGNALPHDRWDQMNVSATATGDAVTLFLYTTQQWPSDINNVYWDDASLSIGGAGGAAAGAPGAAPAATAAPPASVGFVTPQNARDDGSIVHTVQSGDTVDSIAVAYGVTRADILELNNLIDARIIQIGQQLIIKGPTNPAEATAEVASEGAAETPAEGDAPAEDAEPPAEGADEPAADEPADAPAAAREPTIAIEDAPPAPVISVASGRVLPPIDPAEQDASICVIMFDDVNQNRIQEQGEPPLADGVLQLSANGAPQGDGETDGSDDPFCFTDLVAGDYVVAAGAPSGYGLTTPDQLRVRATAGAAVTVAFGAAQGVAPAAPPPPDDGGLVSEVVAQETDTRAADPLADNAGLLVFGLAGVVLVAGTGLSLILRRR